MNKFELGVFAVLGLSVSAGLYDIFTSPWKEVQSDGENDVYNKGIQKVSEERRSRFQ